MDFEKLISERFSVRSFKEKHLEQEIIDKLIKSSHLAPTGCNNQPQRILILNTDKSIEKLKKCTKCHFNAPCAFLVCYNKDESWKRPYDGAMCAPVDAAIVTTHIMLCAHNIGIGSCWVMHFNPQAMRDEFNIPDNIEPVALLVMGYPTEDAFPHEFHNTYRSLDDVIFYESF